MVVDTCEDRSVLMKTRVDLRVDVVGVSVG